MHHFLIAAMLLSSAAALDLHAAGGPSRRSPHDLVRAFVDALSEAQRTPLLAYSYIDEQEDLDNVFDRFSCVDVRSWRESLTTVMPDRVVAEVDLDALGESESGVRRSLPARWSLVIERTGGPWTLTSAETRERAVGRELAVAGSDEQRQCVLDRAGDDPAAVIRAASNLYVPELITFGMRWAHARGDVRTETECALALSHLTLMSDDSPTAIAEADLAYDLASSSGDDVGVSRALFARGIASWLNGRVAAGIRDLLRSAAMAPELPNPRTAMKSLYMAAYIEAQQGDYRRAILDAERVRAVAPWFQLRRGATMATWLLADLHYALHNFDVARDLHREVLETSARRGFYEDTSRVLADLARDELSLGNFAGAQWMINTALHEPGVANNKYVNGDWLALLTLQGRYSDAAALLQRCECERFAFIGDPAVNSQVLIARSGIMLAQKNYAAAETLARDAVAQAAAGGTNWWSAWPAQLMLGRALEKRGNLDDAERAYHDAINTIEYEVDRLPSDDLGRLRFFSGKTEPYRALAALLARRGDIPAALAAAETIRGRQLRQVLQEGKIDVKGALSAGDRARRDALEQQLADLNRAYLHADAASATAVRADLSRTRAALEDLDAQLAVEYGAVRTVASLRRNDVVGAAETLHEGELVVDYVLAQQESYAFLVARHGGRIEFKMRRLAAAQSSLDDLSQRYAAALAQDDLRVNRVSRDLYDAIAAPLEPELSRARELIVIPDGSLWRVPFEALRNRRGIHLIERAAVSYAPSLLILRESRSKRRQEKRPALLALGNPLVDADAQRRVRSIERDAFLGSLPEAEKEVQRLGAMYRRLRSAVFVRKMATETVFKANAAKYRLLHLAVHGVVEDRSPLFSCLVLAPDAQNDGLLEMREVIELQLHADLAVLSACDSGRGRIAPGEGVVGLSWAFLAAGCPATIVSQWKVDSAATAKLMVEFHRRLLAYGMRRKAEALRGAKLALLKDRRYRAPFYWAPFVLIGDGS
jgi:CHAT domain-containing protein